MKKTKKGKRRVLIAVSAIILAGIAAGACMGYIIFRKSIVPQAVEVELYEGSTYETLLDTLSAGNKITNEGLFRLVSRLRGFKGPVKSGHYLLTRGMSANDAVVMFRSGRQAPINLTFNNIRTMDQLAGRLGEQLTADSVQFAVLLTSDSVASHYGFTRENFISMFIPNTYQVYKTVSPSDLFDRMKREYEAFWSNGRDAKISRTGLKTRQEVVTLASIVMEESNKIDEAPVIAGVYVNRIKQGIPLQADPTIVFALGDPNLRRVRRKHLEIDSPYNTYKNKGVPPGPIRMPSIAVIDAVLDYQEHEYIFFCAKPDFSGYHAFARTNAEHNRNARAYSRALNEAGIR